MGTRKYRRQSKPRRKHTRNQRGGDDCNHSLFETNCSLLGISKPGSVTEEQADNAYTDTLNKLRNVSEYKSKNPSAKRRIDVAYKNVIQCIKSRGHVAHPPKSQRPATTTPRGRTLKANPDEIIVWSYSSKLIFLPIQLHCITW
jgi:hypothetical protein